MLRSEVLGQRSQERVPSIVADRGRLVPQQGQLNFGWFPAMLFQELPNELPPHFDVKCPSQAVGEISQSHGTIAGHDCPPLL